MAQGGSSPGLGSGPGAPCVVLSRLLHLSESTPLAAGEEGELPV